MTLSLSLGLGLTTLKQGGGVPRPPVGFVFLTDDDGAYELDDDGAYLLEVA